MRYRADREVVELGTKPVPAGAMLGQRQREGSSPPGRGEPAAPVLPAAPRSSLGSTAGGSHPKNLSSGQPRTCREPAPALGSGQGQTVNHGSSDATCRL